MGERTEALINSSPKLETESLLAGVGFGETKPISHFRLTFGVVRESHLILNEAANCSQKIGVVGPIYARDHADAPK